MNNVKISNPNKVYWPDEGYTKKDLFDYYCKVSDYILPHLRNRPVSMNRFPDGIKGKHFYQKDSSNLNLPNWVETAKISGINYIVCQNVETLIYLVNLGCIEINVWNSTVDHLDCTDFMVLDLDPVEIGFEEVVKTALAVKKVLDKIKLVGFIKTSGATGMHIYIPTGSKYDYKIAEKLCKIIATIVNKMLPEITSIERLEKKRMNKVYIDYLQNIEGHTMASPYSVRPFPGATVSAPLSWDEVNLGLTPQMFTIKNMSDRLEKKGDLFKPVLESEGFDIRKIFNNINKEFNDF